MYMYIIQEKEKELSSLYESQRDELMESSPVLIARVLSAKQGWN